MKCPRFLPPLLVQVLFPLMRRVGATDSVTLQERLPDVFLYVTQPTSEVPGASVLGLLQMDQDGCILQQGYYK